MQKKKGNAKKASLSAESWLVQRRDRFVEYREDSVRGRERLVECRETYEHTSVFCQSLS